MPMQISISNAIGGDGGAQGSGNRPSFASTNSFTFDGNDDTINVGATPLNLRFNRLDTFSFSAWVKIDTTQQNVILSNQLAPSTNYRGYYFAVNSAKKVIVILRSTTSDRFYFISTTDINTSQWYHIAFTYDGTATASGGNIYINGIADSLTTSGTLLGTMESFDPLYLGCRSNADNFFNGNIDEVSIFNTELSASDVTSIYNSGVPNDISSFNPISWWRMGEAATYTGREWVLTDQGSGGNDGFSNTIPAPPAQPSTDVPS